MSDLVSVYCSAIRPELWMRVHASLEQNKVDFEIVYVGDVKPNFDLPPNFRFIYSTVKPAQCVQVGAVECQGNYIINIPDDSTLSPGSLDIMLEVMKNNDEYKTIVSPTYYKTTKKKIKCQRHAHDFPVAGGGTTPLPVGSFISKKCFEQFQGYDKGFVAVAYDTDFAFRMRAAGGNIIVVPEAHFVETKPKGIARLHNRCGHVDNVLCYSAWNKNYKELALLDVRQFPFNPYDVSDLNSLKTVSQGNTGGWK